MSQKQTKTISVTMRISAESRSRFDQILDHYKKQMGLRLNPGQLMEMLINNEYQKLMPEK